MPLPLRLAALAALLLSPSAEAAEPGTPPVPAAVRALAGCWEGRGEVMGKAVSIAADAHPVAEGAMFVVEVSSTALADANDRYGAHLIFGGTGQPAASGGEAIAGYWADSFGGAFAATGTGETRADGFDVTYAYPDAAFVNRWRRQGDALAWRIVARDAAGAEKPFARYDLSRRQCRAAAARR